MALPTLPTLRVALRPSLAQSSKRCVSPLASTTGASALASQAQRRSFASTRKAAAASNRIYAPIRNTDDFETALSLSTAGNQTLITLWTASWCASCKVVAPLLESLLAEHGVGELPADANGGTNSSSSSSAVGFARVELDSPDIAAVAQRFVVTSVPTLVAFRRGEMQEGSSRVTDLGKLKSERFLRAWIEDESRRGAAEARPSVFGGIFGSWVGGRR